MAAAGAKALVQLSSINWAVNFIDTGSISGVNFTANDNATTGSSTAATSALPAVTSTGWFVEWELPEVAGLSRINFVGVANVQSGIGYGDPATSTWYWGGSMFGLATGNGPGGHSQGTHRLAVRLESGSPKIYFMKNAPGGTVAGPFACPTGTLYFITQNQSGYPIGDVVIKRGGGVFEGGGGMF